MKRPVLALAVTAALGGCALGESDYSCDMPGGPTCMSLPEVYEATEHQSAISTPPEGEGDHENQEDSNGDATAPGNAPGYPVPGYPVHSYASPGRYPGVEPLPAPSDAVPVRTPARVARIWVAPWVDEDDVLYTGGYVYAEIQPRDWMIGEVRPARSARLRPLQVLTQQAPPQTMDQPSLGGRQRPGRQPR